MFARSHAVIGEIPFFLRVVVKTIESSVSSMGSSPTAEGVKGVYSIENAFIVVIACTSEIFHQEGFLHGIPSNTTISLYDKVIYLRLYA